MCSRARTSRDVADTSSDLEPCCLPAEGQHRHLVPRCKPGQLFVSPHMQAQPFFLLLLGPRTLPDSCDILKVFQNAVAEGRLLLHHCLSGNFLRSLSNLGKGAVGLGHSFMFHSHSCDVQLHREREKCVSTRKHLLMRNKKQKPMEPVIEQAIRKAFRKVKINHRHLGTCFRRIRLIFFFKKAFSFLFIRVSLPCVCI